MEFFKKLITAIRGGSREIGEAILDSQGIRIYEQEIEDAKDAIKQAEDDLTNVMAKEMQAGREIERLEQAISDYEKNALDLLEKAMKVWLPRWRARLPSWRLSLRIRNRPRSALPNT
jgi:phage shock protein A